MRYVRPDPFEVVHVGPGVGGWPFRVPVELSNVESVVVEHQGEHVVRVRERRLVRAYQDWLGTPIVSMVIPTTGGALRTDAFDDDRSLLIEAKSNTDRPSLRMAVGQLWDYARHLGEPTVAVLLPAKPHKDGLAFLDSCGVGVVWQAGTGFREALSGRPVSVRS